MKKRTLLFSSMFLLLVHIFMLAFVYRRMPALLDSDMSSEMVLGKLLSEEHRPITKSWYYSTEIRVLNTQLLYAFFFQFVKSWKVVRILATAVLHLILTGSVIYCCNQAGYRKESILIAVICFIPLTQDYYYIMLMGCYYVPCISISFLTLGLCMAYAKSRKIEGLLIVGILAFLAGLGGIRQIVILYFPLLICCVVMGVMEIPKSGWKAYYQSEKIAMQYVSLVGLLACTMGYLINANIFAKNFYFQQWDKIEYTNLEIQRVTTILHDMLVTLGYHSGELNFENTIWNGISFCLAFLLVMSVIHGLHAKGNRLFLTVFFLSNTAVLFLLYGFTNMDYTARYNFPVMVFGFPLMVFELRELSCGNAPKYTKQSIFAVSIGMIMLSSGMTLQSLREYNRTHSIPMVAEFLSHNDYHNGYATFWHGNILTEFTNGEVEVYAWKTSGEDGKGIQSTASVNELFRWLQKTKHFSEKPKGKVFILLTRNELKYCRFNTDLVGEDLVYADDEFLIYGYENYEVMQEHLQKSIT
ncbi:MAG: hypothetical protein V3G42_00665 [Oscillospiraceae bacterium]